MSEASNINGSPDAIDYIIRYYGKGKGKNQNMDNVFKKIDNIKNLNSDNRVKIKNDIRTMRYGEEEKRAPVKRTPIKRKTKTGFKIIYVWRDIKGRFAKVFGRNEDRG
jgi:hypothetical protein